MQEGPFQGQQPPQGQWQQQPFPSGQYPQQSPYPQQYGQQPPPFMQPPPPKKKSRKGLLIGSVVVVVALLICIIASVASHSGGSSASATSNNTTTTTQATQAPTAKPTQAPKWTTVQKFTGNGSKNTQSFQVSDNWKILWSCNPASFDGGSYNVIITPTGTDGTPTDMGVNTTCKAGNTSGDTTVQASGTVTLDIISEGDWTIQVQELK